jgi:hypothetical protein
MGIVRGAVRVITGTADTTTAAAGAIGGAAINGVIGGVQGTVGGIRNGLSAGSHSTPAAVLALAGVGATGLVDWPVLLGIGGTALVVHQLSQRFDGKAAKAPAAKAPAASTSSSRRSGPAKSATRAQKASPRKSSGTRRPRTGK